MTIPQFLWRHIKPYKWLYAVMMIAPIVAAFYTFVYNYSIKLFVDNMLQQSEFSYSKIIWPIFLFLFIQFLVDAAWRVSNMAEWSAEPKVRRSIMLESFEYVEHHSYKFFQDNFGGTIVTKLKGLVHGYDKFWDEMHHGLFSKILKIVINLASLVFINLHVGLFMAFWSILYVLAMRLYSKRMNYLAFMENQSKYALGGLVADNVTNIASIFSFAARKRELKRLEHEINTDFIPKQVACYKFDFKVQVAASFFYAVMFTFILFYMIHLRSVGLITIGGFAFVFSTVLLISEDIWRVTISVQDFARAMGDFKSSLSILQTPHENVDIKNAKPLVIQKPNIIFKNIWFGFDEDVLFKGLNLEIKAGEKVGLVGRSGAGKTSLIHLLLRYFPLKSGEILIDGQDITQVQQDSLRKHITVIPQDTILFHRTILENIRYGDPNATDEQVIEACKKAYIHDYIMTMKDGYNTEVGERGIKLSGGQRQRIAIARAILKDAPILVLDEATSALDSQTEELIRKSLDTLMKDKKKTVIAIAHRLSTLQTMNRIAVLDKGKIAEEGTHDELVKKSNSIYKELWNRQQRI
ncbi:MAG: ABC transporter ATP-binding protein [Alphaproteobacteria bacterium]|nr:MAG: ABC transporter ATP-binding protein [Alphaproteobacteria bacterium]